ncbi:hypothetical protein CcaverHIS002_0702690 [Cutaneotrichosporon cavernicola]|nr:hypothetical protein CcaverHIS002_0702690 [Cutaneotrichosporon cavernicola]
MQEEPLPPTPEPASQASVVEDVQPWNVLERRTLEDDSVMGCILPILRRAASIKHPDTLECLSVARLFSKCGLAGVAIDGQKCSRCAEGGRLCISPVISRKSANVECFSAMSRCTNCVLIDGNLKPGLDRRTLYCDIPSRTIWFDCFCNWWMPAEDRKLIRDSESATREYLDYYSFPTRYRKGTRNSVERKLGVLQSLANSRKIDRVMSAQPFPAVVGLLTNPVAVRDAFKNFWDQLPEDTWAYPTEEDGVPPPVLVRTRCGHFILSALVAGIEGSGRQTAALIFRSSSD